MPIATDNFYNKIAGQRSVSRQFASEANGLVFHDAFYSGTIDGLDDVSLCAAGLCAWANCMAGATPPRLFGEVLIEIGKKLGCGCGPEDLASWADSYRAEQARHAVGGLLRPSEWTETGEVLLAAVPQPLLTRPDWP